MYRSSLIALLLRVYLGTICSLISNLKIELELASNTVGEIG